MHRKLYAVGYFPLICVNLQFPYLKNSKTKQKEIIIIYCDKCVMKIVAFVPIRLNSKRVVGKNLKMLGNEPLMCYVLKTLTEVRGLDEIYVYCSSEEIKEYLPKGVRFLKRDSRLDGDEIIGAEIYESFISEIDADMYVLVHTTSPFLKAETIQKAIDQVKTEEYDSALSVEKKQTFVWYNGKPLNYSLDFVPRTQELEPVYIETSAFFMFKKSLWKEHKRRVGDKPYFAVIDNVEGIDIDTLQDFELAEKIVSASN